MSQFEVKRRAFEEKIKEGFWARIPSNYLYEESVGFFRKIADGIEYIDCSRSGNALRYVSSKAPVFTEIDFAPWISVSILAESTEECVIDIPESISEELNTSIVFYLFEKCSASAAHLSSGVRSNIASMKEASKASKNLAITASFLPVPSLTCSALSASCKTPLHSP